MRRAKRQSVPQDVWNALQTAKAIKEHVGKVHGDLEIVSLVGAKGGHRYWECRCKCGVTVVKSWGTLGRKGIHHACRACNVKRRRDSVYSSGKVFDQLTVLREDGLNQRNQMVWLCECSCGELLRKTRDGVRAGKSCRKCSVERTLPARSARATKHGHADGDVNGKRTPPSPTYISWLSMKDRMLNPNSDAFSNYGGRGLCLDPRWLKFENFLADMGERPEGTSIDRLDNDLGYYKSNCRWATRIEQNRNRRPLKPFNEWNRKPVTCEKYIMDKAREAVA